MSITKDTLIGDVVQQYPAAAGVFSEYGLHCVGCSVSPIETVEQGAMGHGMDKEMLDKMIKDANKAVKEGPAKAAPTMKEEDFKITISDMAIEKIKEFQKKESKEGRFFRIGVLAGGCSGLSYNLAIEEEKQANDIQLDKKGVKILIDKSAMEMLNNIEVDFVDSVQGSGFKIENPNAAKKCGCGSSFG